MHWRGLAPAVALSWLALIGLTGSTAAREPTRAGVKSACPGFGAPALAADPHPGALRVFAIQFEQQPANIVDAGAYTHAIDCAIRAEVLPHLARGRPNLVVFDEDNGLETLAAGPRGASARALLRDGVPTCEAHPYAECATLATLAALNTGYARALSYLEPRFPGLANELGRAFVAATDQFVRQFMTTMAAEALRYRIYVVASNTQAPFRLATDGAAVAALRDPGSHVTAVYAPTAGHAYDQTFVWGPKVVHRREPAPLANLLAVNRKVPLTGFESALGFAAGPSGGRAARANLRPLTIPGTGARLGFATSLPAFAYGSPARGHECDDVAVSYMRCLDKLGANVVIQADANDGEWTGTDGAEQWQPLSWMGSSYRAVSDPSVRFVYAVNSFMVGNLADTPFDGQSAILERGRRGAGCHYVGNGAFIAGQDLPQFRSYAGSKPQFLALAPWVVRDGPRSALRPIGASLAADTGKRHYVQTAVIADLPFPPDRERAGCVIAGR